MTEDPVVIKLVIPRDFAHFVATYEPWAGDRRAETVEHTLAMLIIDAIKGELVQ